MKLILDQEIFDKFPETFVGVLVVRGIDNNGEVNEISDLVKSQIDRIRGEYQAETLSQSPKIDCWRKAYSVFGSKPSDYRSSIESLYKSILKGRDPREINKLVDIYNLVSLKYMLPLGGEDLEKTKGDIELTFAGENEKPIKLLGDGQEEAPYSGEVIYKDKDSAICRRWNWREADRTKLTEETKNAVLVIEVVKKEFLGQLQLALDELGQLVKKYCSGQIKLEILSIDKREVEL